MTRDDEHYTGAFDTPFELIHEPRGWLIKLGYRLEEGETWHKGEFTLEINGVKFEEMAEAPPRERAALARSAISYQMNGLKK